MTIRYVNGVTSGSVSASGLLTLSPYAAASHDGDYSCQVTIAGVSSLRSSATTLAANGE